MGRENGAQPGVTEVVASVRVNQGPVTPDTGREPNEKQPTTHPMVGDHGPVTRLVDLVKPVFKISTVDGVITTTENGAGLAELDRVDTLCATAMSGRE